MDHERSFGRGLRIAAGSFQPADEPDGLHVNGMEPVRHGQIAYQASGMCWSSSGSGLWVRTDRGFHTEHPLRSRTALSQTSKRFSMLTRLHQKCLPSYPTRPHRGVPRLFNRLPARKEDCRAENISWGDNRSLQTASQGEIGEPHELVEAVYPGHPKKPACPTEGHTPRMPRMAAQDSTGLPSRFREPGRACGVPDEVLAARRLETAMGPDHRADQSLVNPDQENDDPAKDQAGESDGKTQRVHQGPLGRSSGRFASRGPLVQTRGSSPSDAAEGRLEVAKGWRRVLFWDDDEIDRLRQASEVEPKGLAYEPLPAISHHGVAHLRETDNPSRG